MSHDDDNRLERAYPRDWHALKRFVGRFLDSNGEVEDVIQEASISTFLAEREQKLLNSRAYLFGAARNIALAKLRSQSKKIFQQIEDLQESEHVYVELASAEEAVSAEQQLRLHLEAIAELPEKCQRAYILRKIHGLSHSEIADRMNISVSTVEKHLMKALERCERYVRSRNQQQDQPATPVIPWRAND